jgi:hypothetical protein
VDRQQNTSQRLIALCVLGGLLLNYPVLALFNQPVLFAGIPLCYAYLFAAWALLIVLMAKVITRRSG